MIRLFRRSLVSSLIVALAWGACAGASAARDSWQQAGSPNQTPKPAKTPSYAIQVEEVAAGAASLPPEFRIALYENLIREVGKTGRFLNVFRSGDRTAAEFPQLVVLRTSVEAFTPGSQRTREVTTVAGATSIKVHVQVAGRDGNLLVDRKVEGKVRFFGDNLRATYDLSKAVSKILLETF